MKVQLEGEAQEIVTFFQQLHFGTHLGAGAAPLAIISEPPAQIEERAEERAEIGEEAEALPAVVVAFQETPSQEPQIDSVVEEPRREEPVIIQQAPVKDQITQFLEQRGRGKARDIAAALGISRQRVSARLPELVKEGFAVKIPTDTEEDRHPSYGFVRRFLGGAKKSASATPDQQSAGEHSAPEQQQEQPKQTPKSKVKAKQPLKAKAKDKETAATTGEPKESTPVRIRATLRQRGGSATLAELRAALPDVNYKTLSGRVVMMRMAGEIEKVDNEGAPANYRLVHSEAPKTADDTPTAPEIQIEPRHVEYLRIMNALADEKARATYVHLERVTGMARATLSTRLLELEQQNLVKRAGGGRNGPMHFVALLPSRHNEMPLPYNTLGEAIVECVKQHPGATAPEISIRLLKAITEVRRRLGSLQTSELTKREEGGDEHFYLRSEGEAHPS